MEGQSFETNMNYSIVYFTIDSYTGDNHYSGRTADSTRKMVRPAEHSADGRTPVAAGSVAFTFGTESRWIGHAVTSIIGMILLVVVIVTGAVQKGRIRTIRLHQIFRYHKMASPWFSLFVIGTFVLGLLTTLEHGEPLLESPHGIVGLALVLMAIVQLIPSLLIKKRTRIRALHMVVGYTIVPVFILQTVLGLSAARIL